jgi:zinc/manganese transport system permease protein
MRAESSNPTLGWNPLHDLSELLEYHFMVNALLAATVVGVLAALIGWLMIVRRETFVGHTLSVMAFPGASAALLLGVAPAWGYFGFCAAGALAIGGLLGSHTRTWGERSAGVASIQALALAAGFLFVSLSGSVLSELDSVLFGSPFGISDGRLQTLAIVAAVALAALLVLARPLVFASVDPEVAQARGVRTRPLSIAFLLLLGLTVAATSQVTGLLLVFALLLAPAASAQALTVRPGASVALSVLLALLIAWVGIGASYFSVYPAGFFVASSALSVYVLARLAAAARERFSRGSAYAWARGTAGG